MTHPEDQRAMGFGRTFDNAAFFLLLLIFGIATWKMSAFFHDDALISLRYARNLALHGELAWNLGEMAEGYTNLLHILLVTPLIKLGIDPMRAAQILNWAAFAALIPLCWKLTAGFGLHAGARLASMTAVVSVPVICWIFGGLEPVLVAAFTAAGYLCAKQVLMGNDKLGFSLAASAFFALGYLTRPDTLVANLAIGIAILAFAQLPMKRRVLHFVAIGLVSAIVLGVHIAIRQQVYGELLPLTFYAKVGVDAGTRISNGLNYVGAAIILLPGLWVLLLGLLAARHSVGPRRILFAVATVAAFCLAYVAWSGGDHMPNARILVPLTPLLVLSTATTLSIFQPNLRVGGAAVLLIIGVIVAALRPTEYSDRAAAYGASMGRFLDGYSSENLVVAVATAGSTPYFATRHTYIDTLGLNDPHIAKSEANEILGDAMAVPGHGKGDGAYVLSRQPDVIVFGTATGLPSNIPIFRTDFQLVEIPEFSECYELEQYTPDRSPVQGLWHPDMENLRNGKLFELLIYKRICPKG